VRYWIGLLNEVRETMPDVTHWELTIFFWQDSSHQVISRKKAQGRDPNNKFQRVQNFQFQNNNVFSKKKLIIHYRLLVSSNIRKFSLGITSSSSGVKEQLFLYKS